MGKLRGIILATMRAATISPVILLALAACSSNPARDPRADAPPYGSPVGEVTGLLGLGTASVGAQMLRDDDDLFDFVGHRKKTVGKGVAAAGASLLGATFVDACLHDNRNRWAEYLDGTGAIDRLPPAATDSPELRRYLRETPER